MKPDDFDGEDNADAPHEVFLYVRLTAHQVRKDGHLGPKPVHEIQSAGKAIKATNRADALAKLQAEYERVKAWLNQQT